MNYRRQEDRKSLGLALKQIAVVIEMVTEDTIRLELGKEPQYPTMCRGTSPRQMLENVLQALKKSGDNLIAS